MLGAMLGAHSQCICVPETQFIDHQFATNGFDSQALNAEQTLQRIFQDRRYRLLWPIPARDTPLSPQVIGTTYSRLITWLVCEYAKSRRKEEATVWVDHTPTNFRRASTLIEMFPESRFIHLVRDGRAVAASLFELDWGPNNAFDAAEFWMARCGLGLAAESQFGRDRVLRVRYEDLVSDTEPTLRRVASFAELEYESGMSEASGLRPGRYSEQQHRLVGTPPNPSRVDRWRETLTPRQVEVFEAEVGDLLGSLGYQPVYGIRARPATRFEVLSLRLLDLPQRAANNVRRRLREKQSI
jgi:Sulfotransferase family